MAVGNELVLTCKTAFSNTRTEIGRIKSKFSLHRVTSALASIAISHRILLCARVVALSEKGSTI